MLIWFYEIRAGTRTVKRSDRDFNTKADALVAGVKYIQDNPTEYLRDNPESLSVATIPQLVGGSLPERE